MIEKVELLQKPRDWLFLFLLFSFLTSLSLLYEYYKYTQLNKFDSALVHAQVLQQYTKTKQKPNGRIKTYQVIKLQSDAGYTFYSTLKKDFQDIRLKHLEMEIYPQQLNFYNYLTGFFAYNNIYSIADKPTSREELSELIAKQHNDPNISAIYQALYLAKTMPYELQNRFSSLGISHLVAISGFHLGVLSFVLYLLLRYPYKILQNRYFPYRSYKNDTFIIIASVLFFYMLFLDSPASLLRSFVMLVIGFFLYDRGIKIISMQTLFLTVLLILALFPRLFFHLGFWLSVCGVFYIFLFMIYAQNSSKTKQFFLLPVFVYIMMLPYSLGIFANFSLVHPLAIIYTTLFTLFYPLSIVLHLIGYGNGLDFLLEVLLTHQAYTTTIVLAKPILWGFVGVSLLAVFNRAFFILSVLYASSVFIYSIYNAAQF